APILVALGNPGNMGICVACHTRDIAGALGLHRAAVVQYIRPEIIGLVLGAVIAAIASREFLPRGGSAPVTRFVLGAMVMVAALVFLGCPLRMILRIAGGDLNAVIGLIGFAAGIGSGVFFLNRGYSLKRTYQLPRLEGAWMPAIHIGLLVLLLAAPAFIFFSQSGPGSMRAPIWLALIAGLIVGVLAQRSRLCMVGGIRDVILFKDWTLLIGFLCILVAALVANAAFGFFHLGFTGQPIAHNDGLWNFLAMAAVGLGSVMLGGCPLRQLILSGEGNADSAVTVFGYFVGAAIAHNFKLASSATVINDGIVSGGPTVAGKIATAAIFVALVIIAAINSKKAAVSSSPAAESVAK
ncbi:MAG: YedE-related selenium metabolism membrane protein, partial [Clostridia bacterium]|nr:YedE-related selenium metabolism membrane protein [Clostridia bacterium]